MIEKLSNILNMKRRNTKNTNKKKKNSNNIVNVIPSHYPLSISISLVYKLVLYNRFINNIMGYRIIGIINLFLLIPNFINMIVLQD